jgi:2-polyprenyl-6-methoxyphenol hydroxylase-like FAD-dependent oxidoreductase
VSARLVIVATGMAGELYRQLGIERWLVQDELSMAFGFIMARRDGQPFGFDAVTYRPDDVRRRVGYVTLFRFGDAIRANLFTYWSTRDELTRAMVKDPAATLRDVLPGMDAVIGDFEIDGRVEPFRIDLYRMRNCARPGVVLIGDAYQSVCPSTGMGLSKVLTDVDVLCNEMAPAWFATPGMDAAKMAQFYANRQKQTVDNRALKAAITGRRQIVDRSPVWQLRRLVRDWRWANGR